MNKQAFDEILSRAADDCRFGGHSAQSPHKKGARAMTGPILPGSEGLDLGEFRIGLDTDLDLVETIEFFLFADPDTHGALEDQPHNC